MDIFDQWVLHTTRQYKRVRTEQDDALLIEEARAGGQAATNELQRRYGPDVVARLIRNDGYSAEHATELVDEVFARLPNLLERYEHDRFDLFLFKCAHYRWRTRRRSIQRNPVVAVDPAMLGGSVEFSAVTRIDFELLREQAELILTESEIEVFRLTLEGFTPAQIAEILEISPGAVSVRLNRLRNKLKQRFGDYLGLDAESEAS